MLGPSDRYGRLHDALKDIYREHMDLSLKVTATLLAVIGWFVAQKNPLGMLCKLPVLASIGWLGCLGGLAGVWYLAHRSVAFSRVTRDALLQVDPDTALLAPYLVNWRLVAGAVTTHSLLIVGVAMLLRFKYIVDAAHTCAP